MPRPRPLAAPSNRKVSKKLYLAYCRMRSAEVALGGDSANEGMSGSLTEGGMQRLMWGLVAMTGMGRSSIFLDAGSGIGRPGMHALLWPGVRKAIGVELDPVKCQKAKQFASLVTGTTGHGHWAVEGLRGRRDRVTLLCGTADKLPTLMGATHVYGFIQGWSPADREGLAQLIAASATLQGFAIVMRGKLPSFGDGFVQVEACKAAMSGGGEPYTARIFRRVLPLPGPAPLPPPPAPQPEAPQPAPQPEQMPQPQPEAEARSECTPPRPKRGRLVGKAAAASKPAKRPCAVRRRAPVAKAPALPRPPPPPRPPRRSSVAAEAELAALEAELAGAIGDPEAAVQAEAEFRPFDLAPGYAVNANGNFTHASGREVRVSLPDEGVHGRAQQPFVRLTDARGKDRTTSARAVVAYCWVPGARERLLEGGAGGWLRRDPAASIALRDGDASNLRAANLELRPAPG